MICQSHLGEPLYTIIWGNLQESGNLFGGEN